MRAIIVGVLASLAIAVTGCGSSGSHTVPNVGFLYEIGQGENDIIGLGIQPAGSLAALPVSTFATNPRPVALVLHPSKNFIYVANFTANTVSGYSLDHTTGVLAPVGNAVPPTPVGNQPAFLATDTAGHFLFVLNQADATISTLSIDTARGLLTPISGTTATAANAQFMLASPTANFVYVANGTAGTISGFSIAANGALAAIPGSPFAGPAASNITGLAIDPKGQFLFAADKANSQILSFNIQSGTGSLSSAGTFPVSPASGPVALVVDATSSFLWSANQGSNNVSAFKINAGVLTQATGSPFVSGNGGVTPDQPVFVAVDPTNNFLLVANEGSRGIGVLSINSADGTLTSVTNSPFSQVVQPTWLLATK